MSLTPVSIDPALLAPLSAQPAPLYQENPKLAALCDLVDVAAIIRGNLLRAKDNRLRPWEIVELHRALAATERAKILMRSEMGMTSYAPVRFPA